MQAESIFYCWVLNRNQLVKSFLACHTSMRTIYSMKLMLAGMLFFNAVVIVLPFTPAKADLIGHGGMIRSVNFSSDGKKVVTASFDYSALIWDFEEQKNCCS